MPNPYVEADCFTTLLNVQGLVGRGAFSTTTQPTLQIVLNLMALRAARIVGRVAELGLTISVSTRQDGSLAMQLADSCNMRYSAGDVIFAHDSKDQRPPDRTIALWAEAREDLESLISTLKATTSKIGVRTATSTGGISKADFTDINNAGEIVRGDLFDVKTRN